MSSSALRGCVVTTSGLEDDLNARIERIVQDCGGTFTRSLSEDVTHLVTTRAGSEKHRAICRSTKSARIWVVTPKWILACSSMRRKVATGPYRVLPLSGFQICATNFSAEEREELKRVVEKGGATYEPELSRSCTHLIAPSPKGQKWEFATAAKTICIVRAEWVFACVSSNLLLDEDDYKLGTADGKGGRADRPSITHTEAPVLSVAATTSVGAGCTPYRRVPSLLLDGCCLFLAASTDVSKSKNVRKKVMDLAALGGASVIPRLSSMITHVVVLGLPILSSDIFALREAESRGVQIVGVDWLEQSLRKGEILDAAEFPSPAWDTGEDPVHYPPSSEDNLPAVTSSVFSGIRLAPIPLSLRDSDAVAKIVSTVLSGKGKVLQVTPEGKIKGGTPTHAICPVGLRRAERDALQELKSADGWVEAVTPEWISQCLDEGHLLQVSSCVLFSPFPYEVPLSDFVKNGVSITISGFQRPVHEDKNRSRVNLSKLAIYLGANYSEKLSKRCTTHLVVSKESCNTEKYRRALEWGIPAVSEEWLLACGRFGMLVPLDQYLARPSSKESNPTNARDQYSLAKGEYDANANCSSPLVARRGLSKSPGTAQKRRRPVNVCNGTVTSKRGRGLNKNDEGNQTLLKTFAAGLNEISLQRRETNQPEAITAVVPQATTDKIVSDIAARWKGKKRSKLDDLSPMGLDGEYDWSLEASQSQMVVHKDLTPPQLPVTPQNSNPVRIMPSRAAKSKKIKSRNV